VVSTPYWHAAELLAEDRGVLVPFGDAPAIAREVAGLLRDDNRRHAIRKNAYRIGREMIWRQRGADVYAFFRGFPAGSDGAAGESLWPPRRSTRSRGNCRRLS